MSGVAVFTPDHPLPWQYGKPSVERSRKLSIYDRSMYDRRPAATSFTAPSVTPVSLEFNQSRLLSDTVEIDARALSLARLTHNLPQNFQNLTRSSTAPWGRSVGPTTPATPTRLHTPHRYLRGESGTIPHVKMIEEGGRGIPQSMLVPSGLANLQLEVTRLGKDRYAFRLPKHLGKALITPKDGAILDADSGLKAGLKLQTLYPQLLPERVYMGDGVRPGTTPTRQTAVKLVFRGRVLNEAESLGEQCKEAAFNYYFHEDAAKSSAPQPRIRRVIGVRPYYQ